MPLLILVAALAACDKDNPDNGKGNSNPSMGIDNTIDVVVTGGVKETGMTYAKVLAYTNNLSLADLVGIDAVGFIGVVYGTSESELSDWAIRSSIDGRTVSVTIKNLKPDTRYYYQAIIEVGGVRTRGQQIGAFTTRQFNVTPADLTAAQLEYASYDDALVSGAGVAITGAADEALEWGVALSSEESHLSRNLDYYLRNWTGYWDWSSGNPIERAVFYPEQSSPAFNNLTPGRTYYYCTYLSVPGHTVVGEVRHFTQRDVDRTEFVDLGLPVFWASCNIGMSSPWVEAGTSFKGSELTWEEAEAAVRATYGNEARLPTQAEFEALLNLLTGDEEEFRSGCAVIQGTSYAKIALPVGVTSYWTGTPQFNTTEAHMTAHIFTTYPWNGWNWGVSTKYGDSNDRRNLVRAVKPANR